MFVMCYNVIVNLEGIREINQEGKGIRFYYKQTVGDPSGERVFVDCETKVNCDKVYQKLFEDIKNLQKPLDK